MRISAPSFLHHQSKSGLTTFELECKISFITFDARFRIDFGENCKWHMLSMRLMPLKVDGNKK
jgi:hypothetical protein